jgi:hypothetical protein
MIIAIRLEVLYRSAARRVGAWAAIEIATRERRAMQVFRGEIWPEIRTMAKYRAILHQAVAQKHSLARHNIPAGEQG